MARGRKEGTTFLDGYSKRYQNLEMIWKALKRSSRQHPMTTQEIFDVIRQTEAHALPTPAKIQDILSNERGVMNLLYGGGALAMEENGLSSYFDGTRLHVILDTKEEALQNIYSQDPTLSKSSVEKILKALYEAGLNTEPHKLHCKYKYTSPSGKVSYRDYPKPTLDETTGNVVPPPKKGERLYYLDSTLSYSEWRSLRDHVITSPGINQERLPYQLAALNRLRPSGYGEEPPVPRVNYSFTDFDRIDGAIALLDEAIQSEPPHKVWMCYGEYQLEDGEPVLVPSQTLRDIVVEPHSLMWANGNYYLVCTHKGKMHLRVDRIMEAKVLPDTFGRTANIDPVSYRHRAPVMYAGKPTEVRLRCHLSLLNTVIDFFGDLPRYSQPDEEGYTELTMNVIPSGVKLFALQYADKVQVISPRKLRDEVQQTLRAGLAQYEGED